MVEGRLAYRPIFAAWMGMPMAARRALLLLIPLLILACLLFLLLRPQDKPGLSAAAQTATAQALSVSQTQTALAAGLSQTMTAVAKANGGDVAAANATLTALAQSASANLTATAIAGGVGGTGDGAAIIDRFYLKLGDANATATPIGGGIAGSETSLQYNVSGAMAVRMNQSSRPFQAPGFEDASVIDFRLVATGTNQLPVTRTLSVLVVRPPLITSFDGSPLTISPGDSTTLLWQVLGTKDVTIDGIPVSTTGADGNGQIGVQPTGTRRFIICASNPVGTVCRSVVVTVLPPGAPTPTPIPPTRVPTAVPTTAVPIVTATACTEEYSVTEETEATVVPGLTPVTGSQCDDCASTVMLPFPFQLYDRVFDRVSVGSNGTLNFASTTNPSSANACLPAATSFDYAIFPHWDNLTTVGANRGIFTRVDGDAPNRIFTIEWRAAYVVANAPSGTANFEVRLFENAPDQRFEVIYGALTQGGNSATIGVQRDTGSHRTQYSCNTSNKVSQGLKLIFTLPCGGSGTGNPPSSCAPSVVTVNIEDGTFSPRNIIITQGSIITWVNLDSDSHKTVGPDGLWASGTLAPGQTFTTTINMPGVYYYSSTLDQSLTGNITVVSCTPTATPSSTFTSTPTSPNTSTSTRTPTVTGTPPTNTPTSTATITGTRPTSTSTVTGTPPTNTPVTTSVATLTGTPTKPLGGTTTATPSGPGGNPCTTIQSITGSITPADSIQVGRVGLYDRPSTCALADNCLPQPDSFPRHYDNYTFTNGDSVARCITVRVNAEDCGGAGVMSVAYLSGFDPNNVCLNFLAQGGPPSNQYTYSFIVPAGATYVVVVHEYAPNGGCGEYSIDVAACINSTPTPSPATPRATNEPPPPFASNTPRASNTPVTPSATPTACVRTLFFEGFESGTLGQFTSVVAQCESGSCAWSPSSATPHSGTWSAFARNFDTISDVQLTLTGTVVPESGSTLTFWHRYSLEGSFDGGVLEASTDGGATWTDMGSNILSGGYNGIIGTPDNPLAGRRVWTRDSGGYIQTVVNLTPYTGQSLRFRFRQGTDSAGSAQGWRVDDISITVPGPCVTSTATNTPVAATATATCVPALLSEGFESGTLGQFTSVVSTCVAGNCGWTPSSATPHSGTWSAFASSSSNVSDVQLTLTGTVVPEAGSTLTFWHNYNLEFEYDGGVLEYSTDGGASWSDMGPSIVSEGYNGTLLTSTGNPLAGRQAWTGTSNGYVQTVVNLTNYAGQSLRFRFRQGTDISGGGTGAGWRVDDIRITVPGPCVTSTATNTVVAATATATTCSTNYTYTTTSGATIVPGTLDIDNHGDNVITLITLPFPYTVYGQSFTTVNVSSNGNLQFNSAITGLNDFINDCLPVTNRAYSYTIYAFWDDQITTPAGKGIFTSVTGVAPNRIFNIEFRTCGFSTATTCAAGTDSNYEIRLYEGQTRFDLIYGVMGLTGSSATTGIQRDASTYAQYSCNTAIAAGTMVTGTLVSCATSTPVPFSATPTATSTAIASAIPTICLLPNFTVITSTDTIVEGFPTYVPCEGFNCTAPITLTFPISLYGQTFTNAIVGENGTLGFVSNSNPPTPGCLPDSNFDYAILPLWRDL